MARRRKKRCFSGIGGQAVMEGVMMKNKEEYAVAIRKADGEIETDVAEYDGIAHDKLISKIPFIRGIFAFIDSLILGMRVLNFSAQFYEDEDAKETTGDRVMKRLFRDKAEKVIMGITTLIAIALALGIFLVLPLYLTSFFNTFVRNDSLKAIIEGVIRLVIFLLYVVSISLMKDIRRVYQYHGAEHKCINCIEHGHKLNVHNVKKSSRLHPRCGTSFLLFVMVISIILFFFIRTDSIALRFAYRILLIPIIAGISYELLRIAGRFDNKFMTFLSAPGLLLQKLTTREPDEKMIQVGIASVEAVFDWKQFLVDKYEYDRDDL